MKIDNLLRLKAEEVVNHGFSREPSPRTVTHFFKH